MFDWDKDVESITTSNSATLIAMSAEAKRPSESSGRIRGFATRWLAPVAVVAGLALAGHSFDLMPTGSEASLASVGGLRAVLLQAVEDERPAELMIYEDAQYASFMRGIVGYSETQLLEYAAATARDLTLNDTLMTPYLLDVLWLTNREIERRGLSRPTTMAAYEAERESFTAMLRDL